MFACIIVFLGDYMKFKIIRDLRIEYGYTQQQVADYLGISQNTYAQYELGVLNYSAKVIIKLADFYNVSTDYLLGRTDVKEAYPKK